MVKREFTEKEKYIVDYMGSQCNLKRSSRQLEKEKLTELMSSVAFTYLDTIEDAEQITYDDVLSIFISGFTMKMAIDKYNSKNREDATIISLVDFKSRER